MPCHALGLDDHVLQNFVQTGAEMDRACGIRRPVVQDEQRLTLTRLKDAFVKMRFLPGGELFRLILRKTGFHWKIGLGQVQCFLEIQRFGHLYVCQQLRLLDSNAVPQFRYSARNIGKRGNSVCYNDWQAVSAAGVAQPFPVLGESYRFRTPYGAQLRLNQGEDGAGPNR